MLALSMCAALAACGGGSSSSSAPSQPEVSSSAPDASPSQPESSAPESSAPETDSSADSAASAGAKGVVDALDAAIGIAMPSEIDDTLLKELFYIDPADVDEYYGKMSVTNTSADNVIAVKPKPDKKDAVKQSLERRLADVQASFEMYLPEQYEKALKGRVYERGDYVLLLILGESTDTFDSDMQKALDVVDSTI